MEFGVCNLIFLFDVHCFAEPECVSCDIFGVVFFLIVVFSWLNSRIYTYMYIRTQMLQLCNVIKEDMCVFVRNVYMVAFLFVTLTSLVYQFSVFPAFRIQSILTMYTYSYIKLKFENPVFSDAPMENSPLFRMVHCHIYVVYIYTLYLYHTFTSRVFSLKNVCAISDGNSRWRQYTNIYYII